ncbi:hypothetical protein F7725_009379 [Dissostichus mawsoni]|uniref:FAM171 N-terminal domain-containing protein n=1 Tax=Dissostichus mawsoni TaxID=36200 RepID=A0A7J5Z7E8_DISMA|nr:hypothetical protein F7725_009379 [Dissostichus mawsoni]
MEGSQRPTEGERPRGGTSSSRLTKDHLYRGTSILEIFLPQHQRILSPRGFPPSVRTDIKRSHERGEAYRISTHCWTLFSPRARVSRSGGGLPSSSPGDNGLTVAVVGEQSATEPTAPGRFPSTTAVIEEPEFALRVLVRDLVTRQALPGASVDVYLNHTLRSSVRTGERGEVLLWVAYSPGLSLTLLGNMEGYVPSPLPWSSTKRPIFSAVTLLLLPHSQGNIWLYQDSVLITGKLPDSSSQPKVQFPKSLLTKSDNSNVSSVTAYLTVPQYHLAKDCANCTPGLISQKSYRNRAPRAAGRISVCRSCTPDSRTQFPASGVPCRRARRAPWDVVFEEVDPQEAAKTTHREVTNVTTELLPDLLPLKPTLRLRGYTNI